MKRTKEDMFEIVKLVVGILKNVIELNEKKRSSIFLFGEGC